jgi:hypothetical protein
LKYEYDRDVSLDWRQKKKGPDAAFSFGIKKVGVPADLVLVSTIRRCEGWRSHPRAIRSGFETNTMAVTLEAA